MKTKDPANFFARLASAIRAEDRSLQTSNNTMGRTHDVEISGFDLDRIEAENARLRKALANLLSVYDGTDKQEKAGQFSREARDILSNAAGQKSLAGTEPPKTH